MEEVRVKVKEALDKCQSQGNNDWAFMKGEIRGAQPLSSMSGRSDGP